MRSFEERFWEAILGGTHHAAHGAGADEWAPYAGTWRNPVRSRLMSALDGVLARGGLHRRRFDPVDAAARLAEIRPLLDDFARIAARLADDGSRDLLVRVLALRVLGPWHVEPPVTGRRFWALAEELRARGEVPGDTAQSPYGQPLPRLRATARSGETVELYAHPLQVCEFFGVEQYAYRGTPPIEVQAGDVVVDGGGGWGDTALYFAAMAGAEGRVVCFEFVPENLELLRRNLALNPAVGPRVQVVEHPMWERDGETLEYPVGMGGQTTIGMAGRAMATATTATLDGVLAGGRVDFLKLDVEGAEGAALRGAEASLRRWRPKLAISVYHRVADAIALLDQVDALGLGYRFHLGHVTPGVAETILFADARS